MQSRKARSNFFRYTNTLMRQSIIRGLSGLMPLYVVTEYPKCGGTWISGMLSDALDVPFPRNVYPPLKPCIMQGHYLQPFGLRNVLVIWRDPRDVMVSFYHHCYFENDIGNARLVQIMRRELPFQDYDAVRENLPTFIERLYTSPISPRFSHHQFVQQWAGHPGVTQVKYEDMRERTAEELVRVVESLAGRQLDLGRAREIAEQNSFQRQTGRRPGEGVKGSFRRKGLMGEWNSQFNEAARKAMARYAGEDLIKLGYEKDLSWVDTPGGVDAPEAPTSDDDAVAPSRGVDNG